MDRTLHREQRYFKVLDNRDYRWVNELTIKMAFLTLLFNDTFYIMDSETSLERSYADGSTLLTTGLTMILRPEMRQYPLLDFLIEFKYVSLPEIGLSGSEVQQKTGEELKALPVIQEKLAEAGTKLQGYQQKLEVTYGKVLRLRAYAVVAIGFERVVWLDL